MNPLRLAALAVTLFLLPSTAVAQDTGSTACAPGGPGSDRGALAGLAQPRSAPDELLALIEIPAGTSIKYELHPESGRIEVDRFLATPVAYPANYGILPCTRADDGDHLDVLVLTRSPVVAGAVIRVRPVAVLRMLDDGEEDDKILVVPMTDVDATWSDVRTIAELPVAEIDRIETFFRIYKTLPAPSTPVQVGPWEGPEVARALVLEALAAAVPQ